MTVSWVGPTLFWVGVVLMVVAAVAGLLILTTWLEDDL